MDGLLEVLALPGVAPALVVLLVMLTITSFASVWRAIRVGRSRDHFQRAAQRLGAEYTALVESSRDGVLITNAAGEIVLLSDSGAHILGVTRDDVLGKTLGRLPLRAVDEHMRPVLVHEVFAPGGDDEAPRVLGVPGRRGSDDVRWLHIRSRRVNRGVGEQHVTLTTIMDTTGMREAAEALHRSDAQFRRAMDNAPVGMALVDLEWRLMEVNRAFAEMMGSTVSALRATPFSALSHPQDLQAERDYLQRLYDGDIPQFSVEKRYVRADGNVVWAVLDVALVRYAGGAPDHYVVQVRDSTDDRMHSELLAHRAMHDPLTGLANRTLLQDVLQQVLEQPDAVGKVGVLAVDLDGFKGLNDRFGHATGDNALVHVASVLRTATSGRGTVSRIGGDEFVIVVQDNDVSTALFDISTAIHDGLRRPLQVKRHQVTLQASIGIAMADEESVTGGAPMLLSAGDAAMYQAKASGKSRTELFESSMRTTSDTKSALATELAKAIENGDLVLHYQPVLNMTSRLIVGYEALVRWQHPTRGLLLPGAFLPLLEDRKLSVALGASLVDQAADFLSRTPIKDSWVSVNVSADQLGDSEFADRVLSSIGRYHLSPQRIVVELTEASLVAPNTRIRHELTELRNAGVPILLDDFGTGVSPLSYLRDLPVSGVKLDMSFVAGIPEDPAGARVSRALGALARELGLATIAEGVETEAQAEFLSNCGWHYGQGWLFGVAQPASAVDGDPSEHTTGLIDARPQEQINPFDLPGSGIR